jgi:LCP family protein required for cell wall assembly
VTTVDEDPQQPPSGDRSDPPASPAAGGPGPAGTASRTSPGRARHAGAGSEGLGSVVTWTVAGSLVPGAGLLAAGRRTAGAVTLSAAALLVAALAVTVLAVSPVTLARTFLVAPQRIVLLAAGLGVITILWFVTVVATYMTLARQAALGARERGLGVVLVIALAGVVALPAAMAGRDALAARSALTSVFGDEATRLAHGLTPQARAGDPWGAVRRVNVLLLGGDSGADRTGVRPDTMIVASVDPRSGDTVLISLPRNLQRVPFPAGSAAAAEYPNGFYCYNAAAGANTECLLNSLWEWGDAHPQYYPGDQHPGLTATIQGAEQVTGLPINDYVMLNLRGFEQFIDILGGLEVNVTERLPVGGNVEHPVATSWLEPGRQRLSGYLTLWYARSRWSTTDYDRMRRQRCVMGDLVSQIDPVTVALRFSSVAATMQQNLQTSIPLQDLDAWVTLAERVKKSRVRSLTFTDQVINTARPDIPLMHDLVLQALTPPAAAPSPGAEPSPGISVTASPSQAPAAPGAATASSGERPAATAGSAQDLAQVC